MRRERPRRDYLAGCKTLAFSQPGSTAGFCVLTAVLDARFTAEVVDATQHDGVQRQSRFNLISVALHTALLGMDDLDASYEALARAIEASRLSAPPPRCAPSRLLETAEPSPERLRAAAADTSLERARAIMGETWTNRLAALLPAGWRIGPCYGNSEGGPFDPPCFDRLECTRVRSVGAVFKLGPSASQGWRFSVLVQNEDDGVVEGCCVRWGNYELNDTFVLEPGEQESLSKCCDRTDDICCRSLRTSLSTEGQFESRNPSPVLARRRVKLCNITPAPGEVIRTFYGRSSGSRRWTIAVGASTGLQDPLRPGRNICPGAGPPGAWRAEHGHRHGTVTVLALARGPRPRAGCPGVVHRGFAIALFVMI